MDNDVVVKMGKRIRMMRKAQGINLTTFAEQAGLSISYVGLIERGDRTPSFEKLLRIQNVLGTTLDYLVYGK